MLIIEGAVYFNGSDFGLNGASLVSIDDFSQCLANVLVLAHGVTDGVKEPCDGLG